MHGYPVWCPGYFNPRAYVRHDAEIGCCTQTVKFQSTCLREARPVIGMPSLYIRISIHVPT